MRRAPWELTYNPNSLLPDNKINPEMDGVIIELIEPSEFQLLPDGTELFSIFGERVVKGEGSIDTDTRAGFMAFGIQRKDQTNRELGVFEI